VVDLSLVPKSRYRASIILVPFGPRRKVSSTSYRPRLHSKKGKISELWRRDGRTRMDLQQTFLAVWRLVWANLYAATHPTKGTWRSSSRLTTVV
jgi:hypothetical protein